MFFLGYKGPNLAKSRAECVTIVSLIDDGTNELSADQTTENQPKQRLLLY
jgi:hypothetical protein